LVFSLTSQFAHDTGSQKPKEWIAKIPDGKLPTNQKKEKSLYGMGQTYRVQQAYSNIINSKPSRLEEL